LTVSAVGGTVTPWCGVNEFERIEIKRTKRTERVRKKSLVHEQLGSTHDGSSTRCTSVFGGWQRREKEKIVLRRTAGTHENRKARQKSIVELLRSSFEYITTQQRLNNGGQIAL